MSLEPVAREWQQRGRLEDLGGLDCFVVDVAGPGDDVPIVWLHGFPSSSLDWRQVIDGFPESRRHLLIDFPGFGFSAKPSSRDYGYSLMEQADRVLMMLARRGIDRIHLVAHDMGTSVACELLARRVMDLLPTEIESLVLTNGSIYIEQARLTPSQKLLRSPLAGIYARIARWPTFRWQMGRILNGNVAEEELRATWQLMQYNGGLTTLPVTIRYVDERYRFYARWTDPLARLDVPTKIIWGRHDPVAVEAIGRRLAKTIPEAQVDWLEESGHFPMLEAPKRFARSVSAFIG